MIQNMPIALQLFSVRDELAADFRGTLQKVKDLGYEGVEFAGLHGRDPQEIRAMLDDIGLKGMSAHVPLDELLADIDKVVEDYKTLGCRYIAVPWLDEARRPGQPGYPQVLADIRAIGEACAAKGMTLLYHNHDFEFVDGRYERLMELCPELKFELDTYWVKFAGYDPAELMAKYADRIVLVHLKDMLDKDPVTHEDPNPTLMTGTVDVMSIVRQGDKMGIPWGIVEMDQPIGDPLEAVRMSLENLRQAAK